MNIQEAIAMIGGELDENSVTILYPRDPNGQCLLEFRAFETSFVCDAGDFTTMNEAIKYLIQHEVIE